MGVKEYQRRNHIWNGYENCPEFDGDLARTRYINMVWNGPKDLIVSKMVVDIVNIPKLGKV